MILNDCFGVRGCGFIVVFFNYFCSVEPESSSLHFLFDFCLAGPYLFGTLCSTASFGCSVLLKSHYLFLVLIPDGGWMFLLMNLKVACYYFAGDKQTFRNGMPFLQSRFSCLSLRDLVIGGGK